MKKIVLVLVFICCIIGFVILLQKKMTRNVNFYQESSMNKIEEMIGKDEDIIIYFYKANCISCKKLVKELEGDDFGKYKIQGVNLDKQENMNVDFLTQYNIVATPTFLKVVDGKVVKKTDGIKTLKEFQYFVEGVQ